MSYFKGQMLVLRRLSSVSRHQLLSEWQVLDCIEFDSSLNSTINFFAQHPKTMLVPVSNVPGYHNKVKILKRLFNPDTLTESWQINI